MPAKSAKQYRAMAAAASGKSTLGIPQDVGAEFVHKTPKNKRSKFMSSLKHLAKKRRKG